MFVSPVWLTTQNHSTLVTERSAVPFLPVNPEYSATRNQVKHAHTLIHTQPYSSGNHRWRAYARTRLFCRFLLLLHVGDDKREKEGMEAKDIAAKRERRAWWCFGKQRISGKLTRDVPQLWKRSVDVIHLSHTSAHIVSPHLCSHWSTHGLLTHAQLKKITHIWACDIHVCSSLIGQYTVISNCCLFITVNRKIQKYSQLVELFTFVRISLIFYE